MVFFVVLLYFYFLGYVPLVEGLKTLLTRGFTSGLVNTFRLERDSYLNEQARYIPLQGFLEAMRYAGLPIVGVWFLHFFREGIRRHLSMAILVTSGVLTVLTGQRWPLMCYMFALLIYISWAEKLTPRFRRLAMSILLLSAFMGVILSALLGRTSQRGLTTPEIMSFGTTDLVQRIFVGNADVPFSSYEVFPAQRGWLYGQSWVQNLVSYLPGPSPSFPVEFYAMVTGGQFGYTAPPDFYTEAFINFGWIGVVVICVFWGVLLAVLQAVIAEFRSLTNLSLAVIMTAFAAFSSVSGAAFLLAPLIIAGTLFVLVRVQRFLRPRRERLVSVKPS